MFVEPDKTALMPGPLTDGHHQLAGACDICHTDGFGGAAQMQQACLSCHEPDRVKPFDSHPVAKFEDPRNADLLKKVNALQCVSCHTEHQPAMTLTDGLTQPRDVCFHCHADIASDRPSHEGMRFMSCKDSGCHNYHDNRAIYTNFLIRHMDAPALDASGRIIDRNFAETLEEFLGYPRDAYPIEKLSAAQQDSPPGVRNQEAITADWHGTAHADSGVNCSACHQPLAGSGKPGAWQNKPGVEGCVSCHAPEVDGFKRGKHGMRIAAGLAPMTVSQARLPMRKDAAHEALTCTSCHGAHDFNLQRAAVQACLGCHADEHSVAYEGSPHHALWQAEMNGTAEKGSGVSCATCHMPRVEQDVDDFLSRTVINHNQSATLSPNSKMIRPVCQACHGLPFALDAMADRHLVSNNFRGHPAVRVESIDLARSADARHKEKKARRAAKQSNN